MVVVSVRSYITWIAVYMIHMEDLQGQFCHTSKDSMGRLLGSYSFRSRPLGQL
jgi:hypothetical protein